jgi:uncharacterized repeat protein (TIGR03847 family)
MPDQFELDSVDFVTIGTIGPPGQRVFHLQAGQDQVLLTLIIEKEQAASLADSIESILEEIEAKLGLATAEIDRSTLDLDLREPILPAFHVGQMGLGYDKEQDRLLLVASELLGEDTPAEPRTARIIATREQMYALVTHTREVVASGRPICGNCGRPIDPEGHFCPKSNGHGKRVMWA